MIWSKRLRRAGKELPNRSLEPTSAAQLQTLGITIPCPVFIDALAYFERAVLSTQFHGYGPRAISQDLDRQVDQFIEAHLSAAHDENPACTNVSEKSEYFRMDGDVVRPVKFKGGVGVMHGDRFGPGGVWYYFWRAWYSSADECDEQTDSA